MASFLQSKNWAKFRGQYGWKCHWVGDVLILERSLPLGKSFLYAPEVHINQLENSELVKRITATNWAFDPIFFRLEFLDDYSVHNPIVNDLTKLGFVKSFEEIQPEWRQIIDVTKTADELLKAMKPKGRYNISVAQRHRVKVGQGRSITDFYNLYQLTTRRQGITGRSKKYFERLVEHFPHEAIVFVAKHDHQPLAGALVIFWDRRATYLYGGSSDEDRNLMASNLLHWEIIGEAKKRGCATYDLGAVSPPVTDDGRWAMGDGRMRKLQKKYAGLTRFKQQFGGRTIRLIGSYDLILRPFWYRLYRFIEEWRRN